MCRFLIVKSNQPLATKVFLSQFAQMCQTSCTPDGDWQGDGWGVAWQETGHWQLHKSLKPIWQDSTSFQSIPPTEILVAHARSASFANQKGILEYNQPYTDGNLAFVFNGLIRGVKFNFPVPGKIGAQKIFWLLQHQFKNTSSPVSVLKNLYQLLLDSSTSLRGLNVGLAQANAITALCAYREDDNYFTLHHYRSSKFTIICSQPIGAYQYSKMQPGEIIKL